MNEESIRQKIAATLVAYRDEHNLTQEDIAEILGLYNISLSAYRRAERGQSNVSIPKLIAILDALNIDLCNVPISDSAVLVSRATNGAHIDYCQYLINHYFYSSSFPSELDHQYRKMFFIFVLYLPLIPGSVLQDVLSRIGGTIIDNENYFFSQIKRAIESVQDCAGKKYADKTADRIIKLSSDDAVMFNDNKTAYFFDDLNDFNSGQFTKEYADYCSAIRSRFGAEEWIKTLCNSQA